MKALADEAINNDKKWNTITNKKLNTITDNNFNTKDWKNKKIRLIKLRD